MLREEQMTVVKSLINGQEISDSLLSFYFDLIEQRVKNYCNITEIPIELSLIIVQMVADYCKMKFVEKASAESGVPEGTSIKSITRGDTRIEYGSGSSENGTSGGGSSGASKGIVEFVSNYYQQLWRFRRIGVPK